MKNINGFFFFFFCSAISLTESGLTEGVHKTKAVNRLTVQMMSTVDDEEEREILINKRESSHEYD